MSAYLPPTDNLPNFNPSVFQSGDDTGITLSEADSRYVKKSGSIMTGSLSTPALLVNTINVEDELAKIGNIETATTGITYDNAGDIDKTTINNNVDITGTFVLPGHTDVNNTLTVLNTSTTNLVFNSALGRTILSNDLHLATGKQLVINSSGSSVNIGTAIGNLQTDTTGITYDNADDKDKTTIDNNVTISAGKNLLLDTTNVETELDKISPLETKTTNVSFDDSGTTDVTAVSGILNISTTEGLIIRQGETNELNVARTLNNVNDRTVGFIYSDDTGEDQTQLNNNLKLATGKTLHFGDLNVNEVLTGITYDNTGNIDKTTIANNVEITGTFDLPNVPDIDTKLTDLISDTTGFSYAQNGSFAPDLTTIDNNVDIPAGKTLYLSSSTNVGTELNKISPIETKTTRVSFTTDGTTDVTAVSGILNITGTEPLMIRYGAADEVNVERSITNLETKTSGISYLAASDRTLLSKDTKVQIGQTLYLGDDSVNEILTGISYSSATSITSLTEDTKVATGKTLYLGDDSVNEILTGISHDTNTDTTTIDDTSTIITNFSTPNNVPFVSTYRSYFHYNPNSASNSRWGSDNYPDTVVASQCRYIGSSTGPEIFYDTGGRIRFASTGMYKVVSHLNIDCITAPTGQRSTFAAYISKNGTINRFRNTSGTNAGIWGQCYLRNSKALMCWSGSIDISDYVEVTNTTNDYVTINTRLYFNADVGTNFLNFANDSDYDVWCYVEVEKISGSSSVFTTIP